MLPIDSDSGIKLIMFDLDGTLVHSAPDLAEAVNRLLTEMDYPSVDSQQIIQWVGNGSAMLVKRALAHATDIAIENLPEELFDRGHSLFFQHYRLCNGLHSKLYPGVTEALDFFQRLDILQAVVTNKPSEFTDALIQQTGLTKYFSTLISGDTLSLKKPDPAPLLHCAKQLNAKPSECLMVGDSTTDIEAAENAGISCVCVSYGYNQGIDLRNKFSSTVRIIDNFRELYC